MQRFKTLYRHGDVIIGKINKLPNATKLKTLTLVHGEVTGHSHRIADRNSASVWQHQGWRYVEVTQDYASLIHEEHAEIKLPKGIYKVWQQREYTGEDAQGKIKFRPVAD